MKTVHGKRLNSWFARRLGNGFAALSLCCVMMTSKAFAGPQAPGWMHALVSAPLPPHDEKTVAALLYSETNVTVLSSDKLKIQVREAYKILRPEGRSYGIAEVYFNPQRKVKSLHGWCIPAQGQDFEIKDKDAIDYSPPGYELVDDAKYKRLFIPAPDVGNIVGYEYEVEDQSYFSQDIWDFQSYTPVGEAHYSLHLPPGWEFKATWLNYPEVKATDAGSNTWQWTVKDVPGVRREEAMPPMSGVVGNMVVSFFSTGTRASNGFADWDQMGKWYTELLTGRTQASPEIQAQVGKTTAGKVTSLAKMQALASFVQHDIRYVAIELGIGGFQPHAAGDVYGHRYGDCKDKVTLLRTMLAEAGISSYHVIINTERGSVTKEMPAHLAFNHAIIAVQLPEGLNDPSLIAVMQHPRLGRLLFFDPTDEVTPFGELRGELQANYALLVAPSGGELVETPQQPSTMNGVQRTGHLTLDAEGNLSGEVNETRLGDRAWVQRWSLRAVTKDTDRVKPIENILSGSLPNYHIVHASLINLQQTDQPFGFNYTFRAENYAKNAGGLLLVRPRVVGVKALGFLETKEPRKFPVEFDGPVRDIDNFQITIPAGYVVDDVPPPVDVDYGFASYHSKTEVKGNIIAYQRTFEVRELSVPIDHVDQLRKFYRVIAGDERSTVVLKAAN